MSTNDASMTAAAPGGIGNFGPGLDVLGCAVTGARDEVTVRWASDEGVVILDAGHPRLPTDPMKNTAAIAASAVMHMALAKGCRVADRGIAISIRKGLPLSGGLGGSAASAVAGAFATDALIGASNLHSRSAGRIGVLSVNELLECALAGESAVAGRHLDNIAPSLLGGIILVRSLDPIDVVRIPVPKGLRIVLATPSHELTTTVARGVLPTVVPREIVIHQMAQVASIIAACHSGDLALLGRAIDDRIAEPARLPLLPGFQQAKSAALDAGALGASISGAGPTAFALCDSAAIATRVAQSMQSAYLRCGLESAVRECEVDVCGARVMRA